MDKLKPRQLDIMQSLAKMLQAKGPVKVTTASLANECGITEAAIYRHFPSKRKIYEGLVDFCEQSLFDLIGDINSSKDEHLEKVSKIMILLVSFSEKNPGLARLLTREAFSIDEASLDDRIKQMFSKIELQIKQNLQKYEQQTKKKLALPSASSANLLLAFVEGVIQQFVRSGFTEKPTQRISDQAAFLTGSLSK
ncbi:MAG: nucleoid occlusion factor SlmA [Gammaproteobacteria bacterium]|jgi:TetR/AcrR family transcriptional regulator|nr:nucleoid occlusion factor SlmA [SAR86 cluster bacterium]GIT62099.1 MAG: nucleoid occlusion factor SlmA [Gammaproteobacteria bacterium]|tara:strand:- start:766 stop:1350 length:585 start_codon:yes stop_codon:yes gene_type:complete